MKDAPMPTRFPIDCYEGRHINHRHGDHFFRLLASFCTVQRKRRHSDEQQ